MPVKKNQSTNISSQFLQDMYRDSVSVPNVLLRSYGQIGLTEREVVTLLRLLHLHHLQQGKLALAAVAGEFACAPEEAAALLRPFINKQLVQYQDTTALYSLDGLFDQLYELWAIEKRRSKSVPAAASGEQPAELSTRAIPQLGQLYRVFERELGRNLSPIENEKIGQWLQIDGQEAALIEEALRRAVLQGKPSFAYIDKILLNWRKLNITTVAEIEAKDRPPAAAASRRTERSGKSVERVKDTWLERA